MGNLFSQNRLMTVGLTIAVIYGLMRVPMAKEAILNESKLFGIF